MKGKLGEPRLRWEDRGLPGTMCTCPILLCMIVGEGFAASRRQPVLLRPGRLGLPCGEDVEGRPGMAKGATQVPALSQSERTEGSSWHPSIFEGLLALRAAQDRCVVGARSERRSIDHESHSQHSSGDGPSNQDCACQRGRPRLRLTSSFRWSRASVNNVSRDAASFLCLRVRRTPFRRST